MKKNAYDALVIGSGPNGFAAAITLAQKGLSVALYEAGQTVGGGMRSAELTLPGFTHDICSTIHPLACGSPFFRTLPLDKFGLEWIQPSAPLAHPFDDGTAALLERSLDLTAEHLGIDSASYIKLFTPFVSKWGNLENNLLNSLHFPQHPFLMAKFGFYAMQSAWGLLNRQFQGEKAKGLFAGLAAHSILPLEKMVTAAFGLILGILGHTVGWPVAKGGSQNIANALSAYFVSLGGEIFTDTKVVSIEDLPSSKLILCDIGPYQLLKIANARLPESYKKRLKEYRYGPGIFKMDWALSQPIPWKSKDCLRAGTVHIGGTAAEIAFSERQIWKNIHPEKPFVLLAQQSLFDPTRAPDGKQTVWGYCHVPHGSNVDMSKQIESQIERFAPGFRDCILARSQRTAVEMEQYNSNYVGGDINGGIQDIFQLFTRPVVRIIPYSTPVKGLYLCSSSTPPGGGVHGMCGYHAAHAALKEIS